MLRMKHSGPALRLIADRMKAEDVDINHAGVKEHRSLLLIADQQSAERRILTVVPSQMPVAAVAPTHVAAEAAAGNRPAVGAVASSPSPRASDASGASHGGRPNPLLQAQQWRRPLAPTR